MARVKEGRVKRRGKTVGFFQAVDLPTRMKKGNKYTFEIGDPFESDMAFQKAYREMEMEAFLGDDPLFR